TRPRPAQRRPPLSHEGERRRRYDRRARRSRAARGCEHVVAVVEGTSSRRRAALALAAAGHPGCATAVARACGASSSGSRRDALFYHPVAAPASSLRALAAALADLAAPRPAVVVAHERLHEGIEHLGSVDADDRFARAT